MSNTATRRETEAFYGTDTDTFYLDSKNQAWLIGGENALPKPLKSNGIPEEAVELSEQVLDDQNREDAARIESCQQVDEGSDTLEAQREWVAAHPECDAPTSDDTDQAIRRIFDRLHFRRDSEGVWNCTVQEFREAVKDGMDLWWETLKERREDQ